jgi:hypothetical protein
VKGDYEGIYAWLDSKGAKECGDSLAYFCFEHASNDLLADIKKALSANVELDKKKSRIYVIRLVKGKMKGAFIFGRRRNPPWAGFGATGDDGEDSSNE